MLRHLDGGEIILQAFRNLGIDYIFSSPGSEWSPIWEALARQDNDRQSGPRYINYWHEMIAVDAAIGYTQMVGRPQVVLLHNASGLLHAALAIRAALLAEVPMLILSGESLTYGEDPNVSMPAQWYQALSVVGGPQRIVEPIVKWASQVSSPHLLFESVIRATEMAQRVPMGPVYLNIPLEPMLQQTAQPERARMVPLPSRLQAPQSDIDTVTEKIVAAKTPMIVTESAGRNPDAFDALIAFADFFGIPVGGHSATHANFPKDHDLHLGSGIGPFLGESDLVLLISSRAPWYPPGRRVTQGTIISIDDHPLKETMAYQNTQADLYLEGDLSYSLRALVTHAQSIGIDRRLFDERRQRWAGEHVRHEDALRAAVAVSRQRDEIDAVSVCSTLNEILPDGAIFVDETVTHSPTIIQHLRWTNPQSFLRVTNGLGQGMGVAIGAKLAAPERTVVLLVGDGSFLYNPIVQALGALQSGALPILIVVFNNGKYASMQSGHLHHYPQGVARATERFRGVDIVGPDYAELGRPFGFHGARVQTRADLMPAFQEGLAAVANGRTSILNVAIEA